MYKDSKIYVAGHAGLLGSALAGLLEEQGFANVATIPHERLELADRNAVMDFFSSARPEYVFLAAGKVGGILSNKKYPADYFHANISIQANVFEASQKYGAKGVLFYGSSCCYPALAGQPMAEQSLLTGPVEETSEGYAAAKIAGLLACRAYNSQYGTTRFTALVPCSMYGPNDSFDLENCHVLSALVKRLHQARATSAATVTLWGSGQARREFIFSRDAASASIFAMRNSGRMENRHYNVGTGVDYSIVELAEAVKTVAGYDGKILWDTGKPDGSPRKLLDSSAFTALGWRPSVGLEEGLRMTYQWYLEKGTKAQRGDRAQ